MRASATSIIERNTLWRGDFATEPWEVAWASEALFFIRVLDEEAGDGVPLVARVEVSPDGMHWCDEGSALTLRPGETLAFVRVREFGGWLRLRGCVEGDRDLRVLVYLSLKA